MPIFLRLADCGNSLPPQDAATGNPENPRRFPGLPKWKKATEGFFHGQLAEHIAPATAAGWLVTLKLIETTAEPQHLFSQQAKFLPN